MANGIELLLQYVTLTAWKERTPAVRILNPKTGEFEFRGRRFIPVTQSYCFRRTDDTEVPDVWHIADLIIEDHSGSVPSAMRTVQAHYGFSSFERHISADLLAPQLAERVKFQRTWYQRSRQAFHQLGAAPTKLKLHLTRDRTPLAAYRGAIGYITRLQAQEWLTDLYTGRYPDSGFFVVPYFYSPNAVSSWYLFSTEQEPTMVGLIETQYGFAGLGRTPFAKTVRICASTQAFVEELARTEAPTVHPFQMEGVYTQHMTFPKGILVFDRDPGAGVIDYLNICHEVQLAYPGKEASKLSIWDWVWKQFLRAWPKGYLEPIDPLFVDRCLQHETIRHWLLDNFRKLGDRALVQRAQRLFPMLKKYFINGMEIEAREDGYFCRKSQALPFDMMSNFTLEVTGNILFDTGDIFYRGKILSSSSKAKPFFCSSARFRRSKDMEMILNMNSSIDRPTRPYVVTQSRYFSLIQSLVHQQATQQPVSEGFSFLGRKIGHPAFVTPFGAFLRGTVTPKVYLHPEVLTFRHYAPFSPPKEKPKVQWNPHSRRMFSELIGAFVCAYHGLQMLPVYWAGNGDTLRLAQALFRGIGQRHLFTDTDLDKVRPVENFPILVHDRTSGRSSVRRLQYAIKLNSYGISAEGHGYDEAGLKTLTEFAAYTLFKTLQKLDGVSVKNLSSASMNAAAVGRSVMRVAIDPEWAYMSLPCVLSPLFDQLDVQSVFSRSQLDFENQQAVITCEGVEEAARKCLPELEEAAIDYRFEAGVLTLPVNAFQASALNYYETVIELRRLQKEPADSSEVEPSKVGKA